MTDDPTAARRERERLAALERDRERIRVFVHSMNAIGGLIAEYREQPHSPDMRELLAGLSDRDRAAFSVHQATVMLPDAPGVAGPADELHEHLRAAAALAEAIGRQAHEARRSA
jgi:hypothetical protein